MESQLKEQLQQALANTWPAPSPKTAVTEETTLTAARRLFEQEEYENVACLNFASAKNPGGGFLNGSNA